MKRKLTQKLIDWKNRPNHKPLNLQGARQVGKTYNCPFAYRISGKIFGLAN